MQSPAQMNRKRKKNIFQVAVTAAAAIQEVPSTAGSRTGPTSSGLSAGAGAARHSISQEFIQGEQL